MSIKQISSDPVKFRVRVTRRHPVTRKKIDLVKVVAGKIEAIRTEQTLILELKQKMKEGVIPTFFEMVDETMEDLKNRDILLKTINNYDLSLKKHGVIWQDRAIDDITTLEIRKLIKEGLGELSESSRKNLFKGLNHVFNLAVEKKIIPVSPVPKMKFKFKNKVTTVLNKEQIRHFLTSAKKMNHEYYPVWAMALYTGMRSGELYALKWKNISLEKRKVLVCESWNSKDGFKSTKSGNDRIIPVNDELLKVLKALKLQRGQEEFVLPRISSWTQGIQAIELRKFLLGIRLPLIRFHDLRASWCTALLSHGVEPVKVMSMGGWQDIKTMQIYLRKAGIDIEGGTDSLSFHNPCEEVKETPINLNALYEEKSSEISLQ